MMDQREFPGTAISLKLVCTFGAMAISLFVAPAYALPRQGMIQFRPSPGNFCISDAGKVAPIVADPNDFPGVTRAAGDLAADIGRVSGMPAVLVRSTGELSGPPILVGTLGKSSVIDGLVKSGKLDVAAIRGQWESYIIQVVINPLPGIDQALVIAGSDKRGTIYGIYDVSENIGVSPWYWWADVPTVHHDSVCVALPHIVQGPPAVKYRGIFINDEAPAMSGWTKEKFGGFNSKMYTHMFELLLRLRANYLWPAMWSSAFNEDDPADPRLADEYGIVMGTSHHEPMIRAQGEFDHRFKSDQWDYMNHPDAMENFWREGVRRNRNYENIYTLGMRGRNDSLMLPHASADENSAILDKIITRQRQILAQEVNPDIEHIPQVLALYKEVQEYYEHGMHVPDDVTLLWSDDNFGNLRRVPTLEERKRAGGAGIYYHFDYVGGPRSYTWLNTNPLPKIQEQMNLAYQYGASRIWIVNVGDLKPMELPTEFFLTMAWEPNAMTSDKVGSFTQQWATREFGPANADKIADVVSKYAKYNGWRKPESLSPKTFSLINYEEAERVEAAWTGLVQEARTIDAGLPSEQQAAYFELVLYPVEASATVAKMYIAAARNDLYIAQGRASANTQAKHVRDLFAQDQALSNEYNGLLGGRWNHMMDQAHIGYTSWPSPKINTMPEVKELKPKQGAILGVAVEGSESAWPGSPSHPDLPAIDNLGDQHRWIDVFSRGADPAHFTAVSPESWIKLDRTAGETSSDCRLRVRVDWKAVPAGRQTGTVIIAGENGQTVSVTVPVINVPGTTEAAKGAFGNLTESFTIPASATVKSIGRDGVEWRSLPDYGRVAAAMEVFPVTASPVVPSNQLPQSPALEYSVYLPHAGEIEITTVLGPTLDVVPGRGLHLAVSMDNNAPQVLDGGVTASLSNDIYSKMVIDNAHTLKFTQSVAQPGRHTIKVWMVDPNIVLEYLIVGAPKLSYFGPPAHMVGPSF